MGPAENNYVTQHYENGRSGWNPNETTLTVANVPHLKLLFTQHVGGLVYAQPLYMHGVPIPGQGTHNVVFVATERIRCMLLMPMLIIPRCGREH